jgi:hypothetical protein
MSEKNFKASLEGKSLEELKAIEQEIIVEADVVNKEIVDTVFDLPAENYAEVAEAIRYFLNKQQVQWQYTLGMVGMYDFWAEEKPDTIPFPQLDSVLRALGGMQFTGYSEWARVIAINKYFEPLREKYSEITKKAYDVADKHQLVMEALKLNEQIEVTNI